MRPPDLHTGARVVYDDSEWEVVELTPRNVALVSDTGRDATSIPVHRLFGCPSFEILEVPAGRPVDYQPAVPVDTIPEPLLARAQEREAHILEAETGYRSGNPQTAEPWEPRPQFDPSVTNQGQRDKAKADELGIGVTTFRDHKKKYHDAGNSVTALVDGRSLRTTDPLANANPLIVQCMRAEIDVQLAGQGSTGDQKRLYRQVKRRTLKAARDLGLPEPEFPTVKTFREWLKCIDGASDLFGPAKRRETNQLKPRDKHGNLLVFKPKVAMRPGEVIEMDSSRLNVRLIDAQGNVVKGEVGFARCVATKMIVARYVSEKSTKAIHTVGMLHQVLVPPYRQPEFAERLRSRMAAVPWERLVSFDDRLTDLLERPPIVPETVEVDHGSQYGTSATFRDACAFFEIHIQFSRKRSPTDKPVVERGFKTFLNEFEQHAAGFTGGNVAMRGRGADEEAAWTADMLLDLADEYIYLKNRMVTRGLRSPGPYGRYLSPVEAWDIGTARAGHITVPAGKDTFYNLLPSRECALNDYGFEIQRLIYNGSALHELRSLRRAGKWRVRYDPNDRSRVYVQNPETDEWLMVPWTHLPDPEQPFSDVLVSAAIRQADEAAGSRKATQTEIADALEELQNRLEDGPEGSTESRLFGLAQHRASQAVALRTEHGIDTDLDDNDADEAVRPLLRVVNDPDDHPTTDTDDEDGVDPDLALDDHDDRAGVPDMHTGEDDEDVTFEDWFSNLSGGTP